MRNTVIRLALLGAAVAMPALAQVAPATPDRTAPAAPRVDHTPRVAPPVTGTATPNAAAPHAATPNATSSATTGTTTANPRVDSAAPVARTDAQTANAPVPGANSFTEGQARSRIESAGFSGVEQLQKDDQGIWRGRAMRNGHQVAVSLDYQGNVSAQ